MPSFKKNILEIRNLHAEAEGKEILKGLNLTVKSGEIHAMMGPNGSGKSTLCKVIMNHPKYKITKGAILFNKKNLAHLTTAERAHLGLFLGFQNPVEIPGISYGNFLRLAKNATMKAQDKNAKHIGPAEFLNTLRQTTNRLKMDRNFIDRPINEGFSGGEKKRAEIVQMTVLEPKIALLDEIDSGLDIDALKIVAKQIMENFKKQNLGILLITHYQRLLNYITPGFVHVISDGKIVKSGKKDLARKLEKEGYEIHIK